MPGPDLNTTFGLCLLFSVIVLIFAFEVSLRRTSHRQKARFIDWTPQTDHQRRVLDRAHRQLHDAGLGEPVAWDTALYLCAQARLESPTDDLGWARTVVADTRALLETPPDAR